MGKESLDQAFWKNFVTQNWEQQPTGFDWTFNLSEAEIWEAMLAAAEVENAKDLTNFNDPFRVAVSGSHVLDLETFAAFIPDPEDGDLNGFISRLESQCDYDQGLQVSKITAHSPAIWQRVRNFLLPFFKEAGVIPETIEVDLFVGRYTQTHFGVHRDADSTFSFGLRGEKDFRLWPLDFFTPEMTVEGWPTHIEEKYYLKHRKKAQLITIKPGHSLYWPSSAWHVGECPDGWSITLAVALTLKPDPYERVKAIISNLLPDPMQVVDPNTYRCNVAARGGPAPELAPNLSEALERVRAGINAEQIDIHLQIEWLKQVSGCGLTQTPPKAEPMTLSDEQKIQLDPRHPILWKTFPNNQWVIAANGYADVFQVTASNQSLAELIQTLNQGKPQTIGELLNQEGLTGETREQARQILETLAQWYVFST